jgi:hypothetical protein
LSRIKASGNQTKSSNQLRDLGNQTKSGNQLRDLGNQTKASGNQLRDLGNQTKSSNQLRGLGNQTKEWAGIHRLRDGRTLQHRQTRLGSQVQQLHLGKTRLEE